MKQLQIVPAIYEYENFGAFAAEFSLTARDLIFTKRTVYERSIAPYEVPCQAIFREEFGLGEPSDTMINAILAKVNALDYDRLIAIGGGTIIDIAKVLVVSENTADVNEMYDQVNSLQAHHDLFIIPTTCGTGSEVTNLSIINRTRLNTKQGLGSDSMYPSHAILIPEMIATLPYGPFATSSIDALIHATESYLSPLATPFTTLFSVAAIREILDGYAKIAAKKAAHTDLGSQFLRASNYAGIAFGNAGCGLVHAMSYALGGKYHVAHGESNYQFFLPALELYKRRNPDGRIADLETLINECLGAADGLEALKRLLAAILTPKPMSAYGATQEDILPFTESTLANQQRLLAKSYVPVSKEEIQGIFQECLG